MLIKNCKFCGKEFKTYPSKVLLGKGKYCSKKCCLKVTNKILEKNGNKSRFVKGQDAHNFIGRVLNWAGYVEIFSPEHPFRNNHNRVKEHRLVMEKHLGRYLEKGEDVHHINENKQDNRIENLELLTHSEHTSMHNPIWHRWNKQRIKVMPNGLCI